MPVVMNFGSLPVLRIFLPVADCETALGPNENSASVFAALSVSLSLVPGSIPFLFPLTEDAFTIAVVRRRLTERELNGFTCFKCSGGAVTFSHLFQLGKKVSGIFFLL